MSEDKSHEPDWFGIGVGITTMVFVGFIVLGAALGVYNDEIPEHLEQRVESPE